MRYVNNPALIRSIDTNFSVSVQSPLFPSLHFVGFAFAIENMPRFTDAFVFTRFRLFRPADVGANLVATGNLLFRRNNRLFLSFSHFHVPLRSVRDNNEIETE